VRLIVENKPNIATVIKSNLIRTNKKSKYILDTPTQLAALGKSNVDNIELNVLILSDISQLEPVGLKYMNQWRYNNVAMIGSN